MKIVKKLFIVCLYFFLFLTVFVSCSNLNNSSTQSSTNDSSVNFNSISFLKYMATDLTNARGLSIQKQDSPAAARSASSSLSKYYLLKTNTGSETDLEKVTFTKQNEITTEILDENGKVIDASIEITQDELPAQINKVYITEDFIFIQFVPESVTNNDKDKLLSIIKAQYTSKNGYSDIEIIDKYWTYALQGWEVSGKRNGESFTKKEIIPTFRETSSNVDYPSGLGEDYEYNFEQVGYYNNSICKSYVISRKTGNLYEFPDLSEFIGRNDNTPHGPCLYQDTVKICSYTYKFELNEDNNLVFTRIATSGFPYKDKYGNRFSLQSDMSGLDPNSNVYHINYNTTWHITSDKRIFFFKSSSDYFINSSSDSLNFFIFGENFSENKLTATDNFKYNANNTSSYRLVKAGELYAADIGWPNYFRKYNSSGNILISRDYPTLSETNLSAETEFYTADCNAPYIYIVVKNDSTTASAQNLKYVLKFYYISLIDFLEENEFESKLKPLLYGEKQYIKTIGYNPIAADSNMFQYSDFSGTINYKLNLTKDSDGNLIPCITLESVVNYENVEETIVVYPL